MQTGKVLWVVKHLPLKMHPRAPVAAVAAECAGDQGRFWEMRHLYDARGVIQQTPTFVLLKDGKGAVTRGAKTADAFAKLLEARLAVKDDDRENGGTTAAQENQAEASSEQ